jgi:hypothetical protein
MSSTKPLPRSKTHVRCGHPDCDWGTPFTGFEKEEMDRSIDLFRMHCIHRHALESNGTERICWFDLEAWTVGR